ncbi:MAG: sigma factor-like helix-turn-helix DNA-binding protein, partial [Bacteroidota bacterium]
QIIRAENARYIRKLIQQLPDKQREVLVMRSYAEMSFKEIAQLTNVSINTALGRMRYALLNLRKLAQATEKSEGHETVHRS